MDRQEIFKKQLSEIKTESIKQLAKEVLNQAPEYFFEVPASTTGKHHPEYAAGVGGLVRHTKAVFTFISYIVELKMYQLSDKEKDMLRLSALAHDMLKLGVENKSGFTAKNHPELAATFIENVNNSMKNPVSHKDIVYMQQAIESHMGQWGKIKPETEAQKLLHTADYLASRQDIQIIFEPKEQEKTVPTLEEIGSHIINFGKYSGKTIAEVYKLDKPYLVWAMDNVRKEPFNSVAKQYIKENKDEVTQSKPTKSTKRKKESEPVDLIPSGIDDLPF